MFVQHHAGEERDADQAERQGVAHPDRKVRPGREEAVQKGFHSKGTCLPGSMFQRLSDRFR